MVGSMFQGAMKRCDFSGVLSCQAAESDDMSADWGIIWEICRRCQLGPDWLESKPRNGGLYLALA